MMRNAEGGLESQLIKGQYTRLARRHWEALLMGNAFVTESRTWTTGNNSIRGRRGQGAGNAAPTRRISKINLHFLFIETSVLDRNKTPKIVREWKREAQGRSPRNTTNESHRVHPTTTCVTEGDTLPCPLSSGALIFFFFTPSSSALARLEFATEANDEGGKGRGQGKKREKKNKGKNRAGSKAHLASVRSL